MTDDLNEEENAALSRILRKSLVHYPAPDVLKARIHSALADAEGVATPASSPVVTRLRWSLWPFAAAGVLLVALSSGVTYSIARNTVRGSQLEGEIVSSHIRSLMPGHLLDVQSTDQHNVKPWFAGRVPLSPPVPRLDSAGFELIGGRIDYIGERTTAVVVYKRRQHTINVFSQVVESGHEAARQMQGYNVIEWRSGDVEYWAVSDLNAAELTAFTRVYRAADVSSP